MTSQWNPETKSYQAYDSSTMHLEDSCDLQALSHEEERELEDEIRSQVELPINPMFICGWCHDEKPCGCSGYPERESRPNGSWDRYPEGDPMGDFQYDDDDHRNSRYASRTMPRHATVRPKRPRR